MNVKEFIKDHLLIFDGAMGTYYSSLNKKIGAGCELANISQPLLIQQIHKEYIDVGCNALKTNTFNVNRVSMQMDDELVKRVINQAIINVQSVCKDEFIFADIGPIESLHCFDEYKFVVDCFLEKGIQNFLFETNANTNGLKEISEYIKSKKEESFIICSFAIQPDGYSKDGIHVHDIFDELKTCECIDSLGMNCVCGAYHMRQLVCDMDVEGITLTLMPNAGYPIVLNNRTFYDGNPEYYAMQMMELAGLASIMGGCCGTTPEHMKTVMKGLSQAVSIEKKPVNKAQRVEDITQSRFWNKLQNGQKVVAVELDPPDHSSLSKFMQGAWQLKGAGVDILTIADCPVGRVRMDSSLLACKIQREVSLEALPHMTCRDRNINATKALLMGVYAEGIRNVLLITGDPIPSAQRDEVKSVYQFNSRMLASYISSMEKRQVIGSFHLFGALNVNAVNFSMQLKFAKEKLKNGMVGFLTQPILTPQAFENLKQARKELDCYILGGVIPVVSKRNALFMDSEIQGINVDRKIIDLYDGKNREESEDLAIRISNHIMHEMEEYVDGFYLMTPFGRTSLIERILKEYQNE